MNHYHNIRQTLHKEKENNNNSQTRTPTQPRDLQREVKFELGKKCTYITSTGVATTAANVAFFFFFFFSRNVWISFVVVEGGPLENLVEWSAG